MDGRMRVRRILVTMVLGVLATLPVHAATVTMRLATESTKGDHVYDVPAKFKELLDAKSRGAIDVKLFGGGSLGTQRQLQEQVQLGTIAAISTASDMPEMEAKFAVFDFPFLFANRDHAYRVLDGPIGEELNQLLIKNKGVRVLAYGELGFRHVTNAVRPIRTPEDLRGLKIRVPPAKIRVAALRAMGAAATPMPFKELYTALQQGVVDGQENPAVTVVAASLWEVQKYISLTNHIYSPVYLLMNERFYQGLPPDARRMVDEAAAEVKAWNRSQSRQGEEADLEKLRARGMQVNETDGKAFVAVTRPVWDEFIGSVGRELLGRIQSLRP